MSFIITVPNKKGMVFKMTKIEVKFFKWIEKNILIIFFFAATVLGTAIHFFGLEFRSLDYNSFLLTWWNTISDGGVGSLATQVGNYNIPYQIIIYLLSLLPFGPLASYKLLSIAFDFVLAFSAAMTVNAFDKNNSKIKAVLTYAIVLCSMTVVLNSSFWAQCDSIYVSFILLSLYFIKKDKTIPAFIMLGIAFSFKFQTVFIIPVLLYYYFSTRKISILNFLIIPAVDIIMCLPAVIFGRNFMDIVSIYANQTSEGRHMHINAPNVWALVCDMNDLNAYDSLRNLAICLVILILGTGLSLVIYKKVDLSDNHTFLLSSLWTVFTCFMFLPSMHERYGYLLDMLAVIYVIVFSKRVWLAVVLQLVSLRGYCFYLFKYEMLDIKLTAIIYTAVYAYVSYIFVKEAVMQSAKRRKSVANITAGIE